MGLGLKAAQTKSETMLLLIITTLVLIVVCNLIYWEVYGPYRDNSELVLVILGNAYINSANIDIIMPQKYLGLCLVRSDLPIFSRWYIQDGTSMGVNKRCRIPIWSPISTHIDHVYQELLLN